MSSYAHNQFLNEIQEKFSVLLTAATLDSAILALREVLNKYDLECISVPESTNDFLLDSYLDAIRVEGRSPKTVKQYEYIIRRFLKAAETTSGGISTGHIRKYLADEKTRGIADRTLNDNRSVLSAYFGWLVREGLIQRNPLGNIKPVKCQKKVKHAYSDIDLEKLKTHCKTKRDKALVCFLFATGCRISEVAGLDRENVNLDTLECVVLGKGNKERRVYIDAVTAMMLREYLDERTDDDPALFLNRFHQRMHKGGIDRVLKTVGEAAGVDNVHAHRFRRTRATVLIKHGMPIQEVAVILGHEKLDTTMKYVDIDQTDVKNSYKKYA